MTFGHVSLKSSGHDEISPCFECDIIRMNNDVGGDMTNVYPRGSMSPEPSGEGDMVPEGTHSSCLTHQSYSFFMSYFYKKFRIDETYINTFSVIFSVVLYLNRTINNYLILKVEKAIIRV